MNVLKELWEKEQAKIKALEAENAALTKRVKEAEELLNTWIYISEHGLLSCSKDIERNTKTFLSTPTSPDLVLVRREDLEDAIRILTYGFKQFDLPTPCLEDCKSLDRLKAALTNKPVEPKGEQLLSIF